MRAEQRNKTKHTERTNVTDEKFDHTEQVVFFVDLLGLSDAVLDSTHPERVESLTKMLSGFKEARRNSDITEIKNVSEKFALPAISTFSDNVLISFEMDKMTDIKQALWVARALISALALEALELGFLIRGGATIAPLYHHDGVAIGKGLIEAYQLERSVARYPRIAVSRKLYDSPEGPFPEILTDDDGVKHFNYLPTTIGRDKNRREAVCKYADLQIAQFEKRDKWNEMSKWVWFRNHVEALRP